MSKLVAVVNIRGGRMMISREQYEKGSYQKWTADKTAESASKPTGSSSDRTDSASERLGWPRALGGGWWQLSSGENVRGEERAKELQQEMSNR